MSVIEGQPIGTTPNSVGTAPARVSAQRTIVVWVLIVISCVLVVVGTLAVGVQQLLLNTDRWVSVVGPLAKDATVQTSMANTATMLTLNALDVPSRIQSLPAPVQSLAAPIEAVVATFVDDQALHLVQSPQFPELWMDLNRQVHQGLLQLLRGETPADGSVTVANGEVELNTLVLVPALMQRLERDAPDLLVSQLTSGLTNGSTPPSQLRQMLTQAAGRAATA